MNYPMYPVSGGHLPYQQQPMHYSPEDSRFGWGFGGWGRPWGFGWGRPWGFGYPFGFGFGFPFFGFPFFI